MSFKHMQINDVTHIRLEPSWGAGDDLRSLSLFLIDKQGNSFEVLAKPVPGATIELLFLDAPEGIDQLKANGFEDVTDTDQESHE